MTRRPPGHPVGRALTRAGTPSTMDDEYAELLELARAALPPPEPIPEEMRQRVIGAGVERARRTTTDQG